MRSTFPIDTREALPVRAIPFVTGWIMPPDVTATALAHKDPFEGLKDVSAYHLWADGKVSLMLPKEWVRIQAELKALCDGLKSAETTEGESYPVWRQEAIKALPAACFVWREEFEQAFRRAYDPLRVCLLDEHSDEQALNFQPYIAQSDAVLLIEGFVDRLIDQQPVVGDAYWNLAQLLAWVLIRDKEAVRRHANARPSDAFAIHRTSLLMRELQQLPYEREPNGLRAILRELREGHLAAYGLENKSGPLKEILPLQWADMEIFFDPDCARPADLFRRGASQWHDLKFKREDVLKIWPDELSASEIIKKAETREQRRDRLQRRINELQDQRVKAFFKQTAEEEGISPQRLRKILEGAQDSARPSAKQQSRATRKQHRY